MMNRICRLGVCLFLLLGSSVTQAQNKSGGKTLGIMPVFDTSGDSFGQLYAQNMTAMVYQKFEGGSVPVMLLNPGGLYNPLIPESITDYAQSAGVDTVLVMTLQPTDKPQKGNYVLHVEAKLMDAQTGKEMPASVYSIAMSRNEALLDATKAGLDYSGERSGVVHYGARAYAAMASGSRPFAKQPLGKAANSMAESVHSQVVAQYPVTKVDAPAEPKSGTCSINVGVKYVSKKAVSKAYDIIINGLDQSLLTKEGGTKIESFKSGPVFLQLSVADAPYRLPVQDLYQANTILDCSAPEHNLFLEIGPVGDALLHWRQ
jgi:hypothetical protein